MSKGNQFKKVSEMANNVQKSVNKLAVSIQQGCEAMRAVTKACDKIMPIDSITKLYSSAN